MAQSKGEKRSRTHIVLIGHSAGCAYFNGFNDRGWQSPWCLPVMEYLAYRTDGHRVPKNSSRRYAWLVFQCADTDCSAKLAVNDEWMLGRLGLDGKRGRTYGAPSKMDVLKAQFIVDPPKGKD